MNTEHTKNILIVDDEQGNRKLLCRLLGQAGFQCTASPDAEQALHILKQKDIPLVITDIHMPGRGGIALFQEIRETHPDVCVILLTEHPTMEEAMEAMKTGAYDFATKPNGLYRLPVLAERAFEYMSLKRQLTHRQAGMQPTYHLDNLISQSEAMQQIHEVIREAAESEAIIVIQGESGTGKDLLAHTIHHNSARSQGPFLKIECGTLPETLLETELFGHEKDDLHRMTTRKIGRIELAKGGTLFLDEFFHISSSLQQRLLHVLENQQFKRIGGTTTVRSDVRVVAATRKDLNEALHGLRFSQALSTHLDVVTIELPPLCERAEDIPLLAAHFLDFFCIRFKCPIKEIAPEALRLLMDYRWPGNVRELKHAIEYAIMFCCTDLIQPADLPRHILPDTTRIPATFNLNENEKLLLVQVFKKTQGNVRQAAALLGISRTTLYSKMQKHGLSEFRTKNRP